MVLSFNITISHFKSYCGEPPCSRNQRVTQTLATGRANCCHSFAGYALRIHDFCLFIYHKFKVIALLFAYRIHPVCFLYRYELLFHSFVFVQMFSFSCFISFEILSEILFSILFVPLNILLMLFRSLFSTKQVFFLIYGLSTIFFFTSYQI